MKGKQALMSYRYLIDAGNSRIKVSELSAPKTTVHSTSSVLQLCQWLAMQTVKDVWCASVRDENAFTELQQLAQLRSFKINRVQTESSAFGLLNGYADVSTMGVDRWLAMLAVAEKTELPFAVMMFGTAITCDFVAEGQHLGGWILPGRQLMQNAVTKNTARVFDDSRSVEQFGAGLSTPACVGYGCFAAAAGAVTMAKRWLNSRYEKYCIFLTGGDENLLTSVQEDDIVRDENLVLQGLARYARSVK